jgi:ferredoxin, 2Fe-2S
MTSVNITTRDGQTHTLECSDGVSLMENIRAHGLHELLALCGGNCSCGTCHVHVEAQAFQALPLMSEDENYLLEISAHRCPTSRLSCQLVVEPGMVGLAARIAPEDI